MDKLQEIAKATGLEIIPNDPLAPLSTDQRTWAKLQKTSPKFNDEGEVVKHPAPKKLRTNYAVILENDPEYKTLCYHEHSDRILLQKKEVNDAKLEDIAIHFERSYRLSITIQNLLSAVVRVAHKNPYTPIKDWLEGLDPWDPKEDTPIIDDLATTILNCENVEGYEELIREMSAKMWIGFVARIMEPGCKLETMPILIGPKGTGKSTIMEIMAGSDWFCRSDLKIGTKDALELIHQSGVWIWEMGELRSLQGKTADIAKQFFSDCEDRYRGSYQRMPTTRKRRVCFFGTTNNLQILDDGPERRFWIFKNLGPVDLKKLRKQKLNIWREALYRYKQGIEHNKTASFEDKKAIWWLDWEMEKENSSYQTCFIVDDPWGGKIQKALKDNFNMAMSTSDLMEKLEIPIAHRHVGNSRRISQIMRDLEYKITVSDGKRVWKKI